MARWQLPGMVLGRLKWLVSLSLLVGFLYVLPSLIFLVPSVQRRVAEWLSVELTNALGSPVNLSRVSMSGWRALELDSVQLVDSMMRPAVRLRSVRAEFALSELLTDQRLKINSLRLFAPALTLHEDSVTGRLNIAYILDKLSSGKDDSQRASLSFSLHSVLIREGSVSYHRAEKRIAMVDHVTLRLSRLSIEDGYIGGMLNELDLRYNGTLTLSDLSAQIELKSGHLLSVHNLVGQVDALPFSLPSIRLDLSSSALALLQQVHIASLDLPASKLIGLAGGQSSLSHQTFLHLEGEIEREATTLRVDHLGVRLGDSILSLDSRAELHLDSVGLPASGQMDIKSLRSSVPHLLSALGLSSTEQSGGLIGEVRRLGTILYEGLLHLSPDRELTLNGQMRSALTTLRLDFSAQVDSFYLPTSLRGYMAMGEFRLGAILPKPSAITLISPRLEIEAERKQSWLDWMGKARIFVPDMSMEALRYTNLNLEVEGKGDGRYMARLTSGTGASHLKASLGLRLTQSGLHDITASAQVQALNLRPFLREFPGERADLTMQCSVALNRLDWQTKEAELYLQSLQLETGGERSPVQITDFSLILRADGEDRTLQVTAPWMNLNLQGKYQLDKLPEDLLYTLYRRMPVLRSLAPRGRATDHGCDLILALSVDSIPEGLKTLLLIDIDLGQKLELKARYQENDDVLDAQLDAPNLHLGERWLKNLSLGLSGNQLRVKADAEPLTGLTCMGAHLDLNTQGDSLQISLNLGRDSVGNDNGEVKLRSYLYSRNGSLNSLDDLGASIELLPSTLHLHKDLWKLSHATIEVGADRLSVSGLDLSTQGRRISLHGALGLGYTDQLDLDLENIHLRYILEAVGVDFDLLDAPLTGKIHARYNSDKVLRATASVRSPHFFIDGHDACALENIGLDWNSQDMVINLNGQIVQPHGGGSSVSGGIKLADGAGIDLHFGAERLDLSFLKVFLGDLFDHTAGYGTGQMRLFGVFEDGVTVEGTAHVADAEIGIRALGTKYFFSDLVQCTPTAIQFGSVQLKDIDGHTATAVGKLEHSYFDNWRINLDISDIDRMLLLEKSEKTSLPIYGTAYGSGSVKLRTDAGRTKIETNLRSEGGTSVKLDFTPSVLDRDQSLMRFAHLRGLSGSPDSVEQPTSVTSESSPLDIDLDIAINPSAQIELILGADASDKITGRGEGQVKISVPAQGASTVQGVVRVHEGEYKLRAMQLTNKDFKVSEGGTITFQGDPTEAQMNLEAVYRVSANVADLDEKLSNEIGRVSLPVNCVLSLRGGITKPDLSYAIELPSADAEVERRVRSLLNTPEEVAEQVLYLIALGKFNPTDTRSSATNSNLMALASTLLSEQLSSLLGGLSNRFSLGTRIKMNTALDSETEVDLSFDGKFLGDRLLFRGNLGYHDNAYMSNRYVGEFNLEYKISRSGDLRFKVYSKHNAMYQYLQRSPFTQGAGLSYRTQFQGLGDLLDKLIPWRRRREGQSSKPNQEQEKAISLPLSRDTISVSRDLR